jgi:hypothetical protein
MVNASQTGTGISVTGDPAQRRRLHKVFILNQHNLIAAAAERMAHRTQRS